MVYLFSNTHVDILIHLDGLFFGFLANALHHIYSL